MEAGRELDIEIGKLMGLKEPDDFGVIERHDWQRDRDDEYNTYVCNRCKLSSQDWAKSAELKPGPCDLTPFLPHYSTSIADVWLVVDAFDEVDLHKGPHGWLCRLERGDDNAVEHGEAVRAATAPLALCLAALAAVGVES